MIQVIDIYIINIVANILIWLSLFLMVIVTILMIFSFFQGLYYDFFRKKDDYDIFRKYHE